MASECDSEGRPVADCGLGSGPFGKNCLLCGTDLKLDWPDLSRLNPAHVKNHAPGDWRRAAQSGCPFCNIIIAVIDDAGKQHGCSVPDVYRIRETGIPGGYDTKGFQVLLELNESTARYLLALELIMMPLEEPRTQGQFWGTITIYLDEPDAYNLNLEPFFEIPRHSGSAEAQNHARDWLTTCQNDHPDCSLSLKEDEDSADLLDASIRMLQICDDNLVLMPTELRGTHPYVALSHCWGSSPTLKTLSTNIERFRIGIPIRDLPPTFKDAVTMTRSLGFDYIWIDSLCIIQDSLTDWEEQCSLMASVYGNADLVLAASSASSTQDGFLKERKGYRESYLRLRSVQNKERTLALRYRLLQPKSMAPMLNPLDRRAWALQERLLARRYLAIGMHDMSWACMTSTACECEWWRVASIWRHEPVNIKKLMRDSTDKDLGRLWRQRVLRDYSRRRLSVPSDNLVALSALASIFHKEFKSKYHAGIWEGDLIPGLLWEYLCPNSGYASDHPAPSWSWASLPTLEITEFRETFESSDVETQATVIETDMVMSTSNPFGSACSGLIKLEGFLWRAEATASEIAEWSAMLKVKGYEENRFMLWFDTSLMITEARHPDGAGERSLRRVRREEVQEGFYVGGFQGGDSVSLFMVPLLKDCVSPQKKQTRGLILGRSTKDHTSFERVGIFFTNNLTAVDHMDGPDSYDLEEIVII